MNFQIPKYNLDFSKPITGYGNFSVNQDTSLKCQLDQSIVKMKFEMWTRAAKLGVFNPDSSFAEKERLQAIMLLKDKSIYAYANFKFDNKPLKMRWYQDAMMSDIHNRILFASSNQIGKSLALDTDAAVEFSRDHQKEWVGVLVSKSLDQSKYQMDRIKQLLKSSDFQYREEDTVDRKTGKKDNTTTLTYTYYDDKGKKPLYTNRLICCPPTGSALGYPCNELWLDEFDFWELPIGRDQRWFMNKIAIPRTIETNGSIKVFSNPDGREKELHNLWTAKYKDGTHVWHRYNFNYWDKPGASQEQFEMITNDMNRDEIESTMLAIFSQGRKAYFTYEEIKRSFDKELTELKMVEKQIFAFHDVGAKHDQNVFAAGFIEPDIANPKLNHIYIPLFHCYPVGYPLTRVVGLDTPKSDGWHYEKSIKEHLKELTTDTIQPMFGADVTGNSGIVPLYESIGINAIDVMFSLKSKSGMYQRFKYFMEKGLLHRVASKEFDYQMAHLEMQKTAGGMLKIHHEKEDDLDDVPDTVAGLIHLADGPIVQPSLTII